MDDGSIEMVYDTDDQYGNPSLGINASNEEFLKLHPNWASIIGRFTRSEEGMLYCPMCKCEISEDDCYDLLYDPLINSIDGIITEDEVEQRHDICERCKYHDE